MMKKLASILNALGVGDALALEDDDAAAILIELPSSELSVGMNDTTAFKFELCEHHFTLINTGCGSIAVRTD